MTERDSSHLVGGYVPNKDVWVPLEDEDKERDWSSEIVKILFDHGWTCEYHDPDAECAECELQHRRTADAIVSKLGLHRLQAEVEALRRRIAIREINGEAVNRLKTERDHAVLTAKHYLDDRTAFEQALREAQTERDEAARESHRWRDEAERLENRLNLAMRGMSRQDAYIQPYRRLGPRETLWSGKEDCDHEIVDGASWSGIMCRKCRGWFCW